MKAINKVIDWLEDYLLIILMIAMTCVVMAQVILQIGRASCRERV